MRSYIFTDREVRRLKRWLETAEEDDTTRILFVQVRRNVPQLRRDLGLMLEVINEFRRQGRWRGRATPSRELVQNLNHNWCAFYDNVGRLMVKFNRTSVIELIISKVYGDVEEVTLTVSGEFTDGVRFTGVDTIKVVKHQSGG